MATSYYFTPRYSTMVIVGSHINHDEFQTNENEINECKNTILCRINDYGILSDKDLKRIVMAKHDQLYKFAMERLVAEKLIKEIQATSQKECIYWRLWPDNICKKCDAETKERELYFTKYIGCMC